MDKITYIGFQNLAAAVIDSAWEDLKPNTEIKTLQELKDKINLIEKSELSIQNKRIRDRCTKIIRQNTEARYFFDQRNFEMWADAIGMDFDFLYGSYFNFIHKSIGG